MLAKLVVLCASLASLASGKPAVKREPEPDTPNMALVFLRMGLMLKFPDGDLPSGLWGGISRMSFLRIGGSLGSGRLGVLDTIHTSQIPLATSLSPLSQMFLGGIPVVRTHFKVQMMSLLQRSPLR